VSWEDTERKAKWKRKASSTAFTLSFGRMKESSEHVKPPTQQIEALFELSVCCPLCRFLDSSHTDSGALSLFLSISPALRVGIRRDIAPGETIPSPAASLRGDLRNAPLMASHIKPWGMFQVFKALQPIFTSFWRDTGKATAVCYYRLSRCLAISLCNCIYPSCIHLNLDNQFIGLRAPRLFSFLASIQTRSRAHTRQSSVYKCQKYQNNLTSQIHLLDMLPHRGANAAVAVCLGGSAGCLGTQSSWLLSRLALLKRQL